MITPSRRAKTDVHVGGRAVRLSDATSYQQTERSVRPQRDGGRFRRLSLRAFPLLFVKVDAPRQGGSRSDTQLAVRDFEPLLAFVIRRLGGALDGRRQR